MVLTQHQQLVDERFRREVTDTSDLFYQRSRQALGTMTGAEYGAQHGGDGVGVSANSGGQRECRARLLAGEFGEGEGGDHRLLSRDRGADQIMNEGDARCLIAAPNQLACPLDACRDQPPALQWPCCSPRTAISCPTRNA